MNYEARVGTGLLRCTEGERVTSWSLELHDAKVQSVELGFLW
jgi:hypothetical protein